MQTTDRDKYSYHDHVSFQRAKVKKIKRQKWQEGEERVFLLGGEETGLLWQWIEHR